MLRNQWNGGKEVKISRDGTELETSVGEALLRLFFTERFLPPAFQNPGLGRGMPVSPPIQGMPPIGSFVMHPRDAFMYQSPSHQSPPVMPPQVMQPQAMQPSIMQPPGMQPMTMQPPGMLPMAMQSPFMLQTAMHSNPRRQIMQHNASGPSSSPTPPYSPNFPYNPNFPHNPNVVHNPNVPYNRVVQHSTVVQGDPNSKFAVDSQQSPIQTLPQNQQDLTEQSPPPWERGFQPQPPQQF
jgi:YT521-B-like domain